MTELRTADPEAGNLLRDSRAIDAWLAQRPPEPALDPGLPIIDAHHHLWDLPSRGMRYLLPELQRDLQSGHRILATVFVEGGAMYRTDGPAHLRPVGEVAFARAAAEAAAAAGPVRVAEGIVGHADLGRGAAVREVLEALHEAAGGRLRGVRHATVHDGGRVGRALSRPVPAGLLGDAAFRHGLAELDRLGLVFDAWVFHHQLDDVVALARALPGLTVVLDHAGTLLGVAEYAPGTPAAREARHQWLRGLDALAACPNVFLKLGGLGMPVCGHGFHRQPEPPGSQALAAAWRPVVEPCLERFGAGRCLLESNFPVDRQSCGYPELWNAYKRLTAACSPAERARLFAGTAAQVYRLTPPPAAAVRDMATQPTGQPTEQPTEQPTGKPTGEPTGHGLNDEADEAAST